MGKPDLRSRRASTLSPVSYTHLKRAIPQLVIDGVWFQPYTPGRGLLFEELYKRLHIARG